MVQYTIIKCNCNNTALSSGHILSVNFMFYTFSENGEDVSV